MAKSTKNKKINDAQNEQAVTSTADAKTASKSKTTKVAKSTKATASKASTSSVKSSNKSDNTATKTTTKTVAKTATKSEAKTATKTSVKAENKTAKKISSKAVSKTAEQEESNEAKSSASNSATKTETKASAKKTSKTSKASKTSTSVAKDTKSEEHAQEAKDKVVSYPLITLRSIIITPGANVKLIAARDSTVLALQTALDSETKDVAVFTQLVDNETRPEKDQLHRVGVLAKVLNCRFNQNEQFRATIRGYERVRIKRIVDKPNVAIRYAELEVIEEVTVPPVVSDRYVAAIRTALDAALEAQRQGGRNIVDKSLSNEMIHSVRDTNELSSLTDALAQILLLPYFDKKYILESLNPVDRAKAIIAYLNNFSYKAEVDKKISEDAREAMDRNQRDYYLNEQLKAIKRELNIQVDDSNDIEEYRNRLSSLDAPIEVVNRIQKEISRLAAMPVNSGENTIVRTYIDTLLSIPWRKSSVLNKDLTKARDLLEEEHYGLRKVKDRILEFLAVHNRRNEKNKEPHGQILCLMGPPGIGKTSLAASIAKATGRKYVRVALGGMYDESEIRGHRRTYIGAMPGRIVQNMCKVEVNNPLFLLDEIDKVSQSTHHGDISAALLEVLDPEQNKSFNDNYVDLDIDLSKVLFIATANSYNIPPALRDRMEIIDLSSYTADEKFHIAREHLIRKQLEKNALDAEEFDISDAAIKRLITHYTLEAGVRNLERIIGELCRKTVKNLMLEPPKEQKKIVLGVKEIEELIGPKRYDFTSKLKDNRVGIVNGLSVSSYGGDMLQVEVIANDGKGSHLLTGQLGSVMKESVSAAISWVRSHAKTFSLAPDFYQQVDLHVHFPEGAIKKDGPSAGIATVTSIVSALTGNPVRADVAMTGEITLRGDVLIIGGLKEKLLAALRGGVKTVCIPEDNKKDLWDIPENITKGLKIVPVKTINEVLDIALETKPSKFKPTTAEQWTLVNYEERQKKRKLKEESEERKFQMEIKAQAEVNSLENDKSSEDSKSR